MTRPAVKDVLPATREATLPAETGGPTSIIELMRFALQHGKAEDMERLVALHDRMEDRRAAQEFAAALADFQASCPSIRRTSKATHTTDGGRQFSYTYAELDEIAATVGPHLHSRGLSFSWDTATTDKGMLSVCTLRHANGHSVSASFPIVQDTRPNKAISDSQKLSAATTPAMRKALIMVLGLTSTDPDGDGAAPENFQTITASQAADLAALVDEVSGRAKDPKAVLPRLLKYAGVSKLADIKIAKFDDICAKLRGMGK